MSSQPKAAHFSAWQRWTEGPRLNHASLIETLDGGQAFRWARYPDYLEGRWSDQVFRIKVAPGSSDLLEYSVPVSPEPTHALNALKHYFACAVDFAHHTDCLPWRSDPVLTTAIQAFPGLRILRQPFAECLFSFLCSSTKQIPQIKAIHEIVATTLGSQLPDGSHRLPTWPQIAAAGEAPLRAAKLGYRARYIYQTAEYIATAGTDWLREVEAMPTELARAELLRLPGVGRKIADCVLLFGAGRLDAFPIDTWVEKILTRAYQLEGWKLPQLQQFANAHFGPLSGYAQQYLFAAARAGKIAS
jgi:N-glycosylase/DNA lyase